MATYTVTVPDEDVAPLEAAFCDAYGYQPTLPDGTPNPVTSAAFTQQRVVDFILDVVRAWLVKQAVAKAQETAQAAPLPAVTVTQS